MSSPIDSTLPGSAGQADQAELARQKMRMDRLRQRMESGGSSEKELREVCMDFEAVFLNKLWKQMRATIPKEGYLHSKYEEQYTSMFDHELSKKLARSGGIGLADMLFEQLQTRLKQASRETGAADVRALGPRDNLSGVPFVSSTGPAPEPLDSEPLRHEDDILDPSRLSGSELMRRIEDLADTIERREAPVERAPRKAIERYGSGSVAAYGPRAKTRG